MLRLHAREGLIDLEKMYVDFDVYRPIGRLFGNLYAAQRDTFALSARKPRAMARAQRSGRTVRPKSVMRELHGAQRHGHGRLGRVDHGNPERLLQRPAVTRHAGAAHHDGAGIRLRPSSARPTSIIFASVPSPDCCLGHAHVRAAVRLVEAVHQAHLPAGSGHGGGSSAARSR